MRIIQFIIGLVILSAIASTFFLLRDQSISPKLAHTASKKISPSPNQASVISSINEAGDTLDTSTETIVSDVISNEEIIVSSTDSPAEAILIEEVPLTPLEVASLSSLIHSLSNLSRSQNNLPPLTLDKRLVEMAEARSRDMIENNYFSHTSNDDCGLSCRFEAAGYHSLVWGENLALSRTRHLYTPEELAKTFMQEWLKSSTHRDNLLSMKYTHHGIGIAEKNDRIIVTVLFAKPE